MTEELEPRRRPTQDRSRARVAAILQSTREILVEVGIEALTCEDIAQRAEVPVGTVYQFFPNKFSIVAELDRLDTEAVSSELERFGNQVPSLDWEALLDALIDHLADLWRDQPPRRAVWLSMQATPATRSAAAEHERQLALQVRDILIPIAPKTTTNARNTIAEVVVHTCYSMLNFSVRDGQHRPSAVRELKRMLKSYVRQLEQDSIEAYARASAEA